MQKAAAASGAMATAAAVASAATVAAVATSTSAAVATVTASAATAATAALSAIFLVSRAQEKKVDRMTTDSASGTKKPVTPRLLRWAFPCRSAK